MILRFFKRMLVINYLKKPSYEAYGYTSRTSDGMHCLFLDYDGVSPDIVMHDIKNLSDSVSHFFVFCSDEHENEQGVYGNYHVISVDKFSFGDVLDLQRVTHCDENYKSMVRRTKYRSWVLRFSAKAGRKPPVYKSLIVTGNESLNGHSEAHLKMIGLLNTETIKDIEANETLWDKDGLTTATVTHYRTGKARSE